MVAVVRISNDIPYVKSLFYLSTVTATASAFTWPSQKHLELSDTLRCKTWHANNLVPLSSLELFKI